MLDFDCSTRAATDGTWRCGGDLLRGGFLGGVFGTVGFGGYFGMDPCIGSMQSDGKRIRESDAVCRNACWLLRIVSWETM